MTKIVNNHILSLSFFLILYKVALKIRQVGDQLDGRLKHKIKEAMQDLITEQSVWEIGYGQFSSTCSGILSSCQVIIMIIDLMWE